jgi:hypothetical protein
VHAEDVGLEKPLRISDRAVDVRLRREVHDGVYPRHHVVDGLPVADVAPNEAVAWVVLDRSQVLEVPRVGEFVEIHDLAVRVSLEVHADEVTADEAGAARDQELHLTLRFVEPVPRYLTRRMVISS